VSTTTSAGDEAIGFPPQAFTTNPRFSESLTQRLRRWVLGCGYALVPKRIGLLPRLIVLSAAHLLAPEAVRERLPEQPYYYSKRGLVGISNDLSVGALLANYKRGDEMVVPGGARGDRSGRHAHQQESPQAYEAGKIHRHV
jgi:hypothetical protein